jgi:hypothetical protein
MFVSALAYSRKHLLDGFIPDGFVSGSVSFSEPLVVARALASRKVSLWHRTRGGYLIHDFDKWNKSRSQIKEIREKWRLQKAAQRRGGNGQYHEESSADTSHVRKVSHRTRARSHDPRSTKGDVRTPVDRDRSGRTGLSTVRVLTDAARRDSHTKERKPYGDGTSDHVSDSLRDRNGGALTRSRDRRQRMDGTRQASDRRATLRVSDAARSHGGASRDGARAREARDRSHVAAVSAAAVSAAARRDARVARRALVSRGVRLCVFGDDRRIAPPAPGERQAA